MLITLTRWNTSSRLHRLEVSDETIYCCSNEIWFNYLFLCDLGNFSCFQWADLCEANTIFSFRMYFDFCTRRTAGNGCFSVVCIIFSVRPEICDNGIINLLSTPNTIVFSYWNLCAAWTRAVRKTFRTYVVRIRIPSNMYSILGMFV